MSLGRQDHEVSGACRADVENLLDHIPAPHRPVPGPPRLARLVYHRHLVCGTDMQQREGDLLTAQGARETCRHIHCGLWVRHLSHRYEDPAQHHGTIVERNKPLCVRWHEQSYRPCTACHRFRDRPVQPSGHPGTLMRREHDQVGRVRIEIVQQRAHGVRPGT